MLNDLSDRAFAWLMAILLSMLVVSVVIWRMWDTLPTIGHWTLISLAIIIGVLFVYVLVRLYLDLHSRAQVITLARKEAQLQAEEAEARRKRDIQDAEWRRQLERERHQAEISLQHQRLALDQQRFALEQHVTLTRIMPTSNGHYPALVGLENTSVSYIEAPRLREQMTGLGSIGQGTATKEKEIDRLLSQGEKLPPPTDVHQLLVSGQWVPDRDNLLFAIGPLGALITVGINIAYHIALAGSTGGGKTNMLRLLLAQLVRWYECYYISPAFAPVKKNHEDWRPISAKLAGPVARKSDEIRFRLEWAVNMVNKREDAEFAGDFSWKGKPIYIVVDEYKEVIYRCPEAVEHVSDLLRRARQFEIFVIVAAQDFLIKNIGGDSGARDCYRSALYFGGDPNTMRALLDMQGTLPFEEQLGLEGRVVVRTKTTRTSQARTPLMSNLALYELLGWPNDPILDDSAILNQLGITVLPGTRYQEHQKRDEGHSNEYPANDSVWSVGPNGEVNTNAPGTSEKETDPLLMRAELSTDEYQVLVIDEDYPRFTDLQVAEFIAYYRECGNINKCLEKMKKGRSFQKHASALVEQYELRKGVY